MQSLANQPDRVEPKWLVLAEIALIFAVFFIQGAWPVPDVNEPYYLGKAIHYWNPSWVKGDFFLDSADAHVVFYFTFGWLSLWLSSTVLAWTGRILTWWLLAWSWRRLSFAVFPKVGWAIVTGALFAMLMERCHMAGEWVIGGVEAKGFAYVLVFLGLESLVNNRWNRAWLLFGAASAFHVLVGGWAVIAAGLAWLFVGRDRPALKTMLPALLGGFLLSLPGLLPSVMLNLHVDPTTIQQANEIYVFDRLPHHLNLFHIEPFFIIRLLLLTEAFFLVSWAIELSDSKKSIGTRRWERLAMASAAYNEANPGFMRFRAFVLGAILVSLVGALINLLVFIDSGWAANLLRFYWFRQTDVVIPMSVAILGCMWIVESCRLRRAIGVISAIVLALVTAYHFADLSLVRLHPSEARADLGRVANPQDWREACFWVADEKNTPPTARFITPRMSQSFKWYARRAEVVNWKDIPQDAKDLVEWKARIQDLYVPQGNDPSYRWYETLNEMSAKRIRELGKKYQANYIILEAADDRLGLKEVYLNKGYAVYEIRDK